RKPSPRKTPGSFPTCAKPVPSSSARPTPRNSAPAATPRTTSYPPHATPGTPRAHPAAPAEARRPPSPQALHPWPTAVTVADPALMLDVMDLNRPGDQFGAAPLPRGKSFTDHTRKTPGRLRIGCYANAPGITLDPDVLVAHEATGQLLEELGHDVEEIPTPFEAHFHGRFPEDFQVLWAAMASTIPVPKGREEELRPLNRWLRELAAS